MSGPTMGSNHGVRSDIWTRAEQYHRVTLEFVSECQT
jgi:hypothetical protein